MAKLRVRAEPKGAVPSGGVSLTAGALAITVAAVVASAGTTFLLRTPLPAAVDGSSTGTVRHLFATPLYHDNIAGHADMAELAELATDGYRALTVDPDGTLVKSIRQSKARAVCSALRGLEHRKCSNVLQDINQFTYNDMLFHWQMNHGTDGMPKFGGFSPHMVFFRRSDAHTPALKGLLDHIRDTAVPRYMQALGVDDRGMKAIFEDSEAIPDLETFGVQIWAGVASENGHVHQVHEHFTDGECLCSGVVYAQAPSGSGPISFKDVRQPRTGGDTAGFFPSRSYHHTPATGDLLLFPPWAPHEVKRSDGFNPDGTDAPRVAWAFNVLTLKGLGQQTQLATAGAAARATRDLHATVMNVTGGAPPVHDTSEF